MADEPEIGALRRRLAREREARRQAEDIAEASTRQLYLQSQTITALASISGIANESATLDEALERALPVVAWLVGADVGHAFLPDDDGRFRSSGVWFESAPGLATEIREATGTNSVELGEGLPGRVAVTRRPEWIEELRDPDRFLRLHLAPGLVGRSVLAFPVLAGEDVVAVGELFRPMPTTPDPEVMEAISQAGTVLGRVAERQTSLDQVRRLNAQLEAKVLERTEQLAEAWTVADAASRAKSELLANLGHELRTPLSAVLGMLDLALESELPGEVADDLRVALRSARVLDTHVERLLTMAALEADRLVLDPRPVDLRGLLGDLVAELVPRAEAKGLITSLRLDPSVPATVTTDGARLTAALGALLDNAVKFTPEGSVIVTARLQRADEVAGTPAAVRIEVHDTGVGMDQAEVARLTESFVTGDPSPSRVHPGVGLGLSTASRLLGLLGAQLGVHTGPEIGTKFWADLPLATPVETAASGAAALGRRVLLVEDNEVNRRIAGAYLDRLGLLHDQVVDGQQAVDAVAEGGYGLVLMDLQMPVMDGYEATAAIRALPAPIGRLPIVAVTASSFPGDRERCLAAGMDDYLAKPFGRDELAAVVLPLLDPSADGSARRDTMHGDE